MVFPKARVVVSAGLFLAWIGFLAYLAARTRDPVILSRPQFLVSNLVVLAEIGAVDDRPAARITVKEVLRSADPSDADLVGKEIAIPDIVDCVKSQGWHGAGQYIVPLVKHKGAKDFSYRVTPLPTVPGYHSKFMTVELVCVGNNKEQVAGLLKKYFDLESADFEMNDKKPDALIARPLRHNVPIAFAQEFEKAMLGAGAIVDLRKSETRIYRATPDALTQWREIAPSRGE
jgi:hypothetical protein